MAKAPGRLYPRRRILAYMWGDFRRWLARHWKRVAMTVYEWIWP
jgi:hypothetical protein